MAHVGETSLPRCSDCDSSANPTEPEVCLLHIWPLPCRQCAAERETTDGTTLRRVLSPADTVTHNPSHPRSLTPNPATLRLIRVGAQVRHAVHAHAVESDVMRTANAVH